MISAENFHNVSRSRECGRTGDGKLGPCVPIAQLVASNRDNATDGGRICEGQASSLLVVPLLIILRNVFLQLLGELKCRC